MKKNEFIGKEIVILIEETKFSDIELFFGPINHKIDHIIESGVFDKDTLMHQLLRRLGFIKNNKQAKDINMFGQISEGFSDFFVGKKKRRLSILKINKKE